MSKGGKSEGQQVRWAWKNLEPGPQDDFSIWLITPERWEAIQDARAAVEAGPGDGQAWLTLCGLYHSLSTNSMDRMVPGFGETYPPLALQACLEAARLLPGDAAPHYELALLYLSTLPENPSPEVLQPVVDELELGQALEAARPPSEISFAWNPYDDYTSLSELITDRVNGILSETGITTEAQTVTPEAVAEETPPANPTSLISPTPAQPVTEPFAESQQGMGVVEGRTLILLISGGVVLMLVGYLIVKRK
jgi:hypothetical protein